FDPEQPYANLLATVVPKVHVSVAFHYLEGPDGIDSVFFPGHEVPWLETMNQIYEPQANITFTGVPAHRIRISGLASPVRLNDPNRVDWKKIANDQTRDPDATFNVFCIGDFTDNPGVLARTEQAGSVRPVHRDCIIKDHMFADRGAILAHEAGHALGQDDED